MEPPWDSERNTGRDVEFKVDGSPADIVASSFNRYSQHQSVSEILLVTTQPRASSRVPDSFNVKPLLGLLAGSTPPLSDDLNTQTRMTRKPNVIRNYHRIV